MTTSVFFDTSVLVYAFDSTETEKHNIALKLIEEVMATDECVISSQVLLELYNVLTKFVTNPIPREEAESIVKDFANSTEWRKLDCNFSTAMRAIEESARLKTDIWDALIAETMKENYVYIILTENERDFKKINGIKVVNPFKKKLD